MKVALYARFSSENQKESSITDQFRTCEQRAAREGWTITARYADRAISGSTTERPQYQQMLQDAKAKKFDILLLDDLSRLTRDEAEAIQVRKRLVFWGVRLVTVSDGIDTSQKGHKLQASFKGLMNSVFLDDLKDKITRGMIGQAEKCYWQGGKVYGYRLVPELHPTKTDPYGNPERIGTRLEIHPEQAEVVRQIFTMYADGMSPLKIVNALNRQKIPAPGASYNRAYRRPSSWSAAALHGDLSRGTGLLNNPLYVGRYVWNRSRREKNPDTQRKAHIPRPREEWIEKPVPHLRIIDDALWERVKARRQGVSQSVAALRASLHCRARSTGRSPKYLFSGLLKCGVCQQPFIVCESTKYGCSTGRTRGESECSNAVKVPRKLVESLLLEAIQRDLFTDEGIAAFKRDFMRELAERQRTLKPDMQEAQKRLQTVEAEIANILKAIKAGILTASTKLELEQAEAERERLSQMVQGPHKRLSKITTLVPDLTQRFKRMLGELATVTQAEVDRARGILRQLVGGEILLHPTSDGAERYLMAELTGDYFGLLRLAGEPKIKLVAVTRIERVTRGL